MEILSFSGDRGQICLLVRIIKITSPLQVKVRQFQLFMKSGGFEALDFSAMVQVHSEYNSIGHPTLTLWDLGPRRTNGSMKPLLPAVP